MRQKQSETQKIVDSRRYILHRIYDGNTQRRLKSYDIHSPTHGRETNRKRDVRPAEVALFRPKISLLHRNEIFLRFSEIIISVISIILFYFLINSRISNSKINDRF